MKKSRFIFLALAMAVMLMGAGYAYWTDTLTIDNTVTTGELNVYFTEANLATNESGTQYLEFEEPTVNDKDVTMLVEKLYPGAEFSFDFTVENNGTIPAVLNGVTVEDGTVPSGYESADRIPSENFLVKGTITGPGTATYTIPEGYNLGELNDIVNNYSNYISPRLEPTETVTFDLDIQLDPTVGNVDPDEYENSFASLLYTANFKQHNQP